MLCLGSPQRAIRRATQDLKLRHPCIICVCRTTVVCQPAGRAEQDAACRHGPCHRPTESLRAWQLVIAASDRHSLIKVTCTSCDAPQEKAERGQKRNPTGARPLSTDRNILLSTFSIAASATVESATKHEACGTDHTQTCR